MNPRTTKVCADRQGRGCYRMLPLSEFHRNHRMPDGRATLCRDCRCEIERERRAGKADEINARNRARYKANPEPVRGRNRESYKRQATKRRAYRRDYVEANREEIRAREREAYRRKRDAKAA